MEKHHVIRAKRVCRAYGNSGFQRCVAEKHFTHYQGYVTNTNKELELLEKLLKKGGIGVASISSTSALDWMLS
jgi:Fe-Mn family superoxide dismutase